MHKCLDIFHTNLHIILRRPRGPLQPRGNRAIHVLHSLFSVSDTKMLLGVRKKTYPSADELSLQLLEKGQAKPTTMKLSEVLTRFEPFSYLVQTKVGTEETPGTYRLLKFNNPGDRPLTNRKKGPTSGRYYKRKGRGKETHFITDCPAALLRHRLKIAYAFLLEGSRMELHLRAKASGRADSVDSALRNHLHLRPDTILAAMPPGTTMLAVPGTTQSLDEELQGASKFRVNKTSDVFWVMENAAALKRCQVTTPRHIKRLGTWTDHQKYIQAAMDESERARIKKRARRIGEERIRIEKERIRGEELQRPGRFSGNYHWRPGQETEDPEMQDGDMPHLSELMPKRERDDGSLGSDAPSLSNFIPFVKSGRE